MIEEHEIQKLVSASQQGNEESFGQLYDLYSKPLYNFLFSKVRHRQTCEDLIHTVFLKAWTNLGNYQPRSNAKFSTWLYQIANYTLIDYWRVKKEVVELDKIENLSTFATDGPLYENYEYLWSAISQLPIDYQVVLDLKFKQDLSVSEIAKIMNKSEVATRVLQHRALKALKKSLGDKL